MSRPRVLMWHAFGDRDDTDDPWRLFVPVRTFERQLAALRARGAHFLTLEGYLAGLPTGRWPARSVLVTIDDGYASTLHDAAPVLARHEVPAVLFALAGSLGGTSRWMAEMPDEQLLDADGLRAITTYGVEVGVHGWDHALLPGLTPPELRRQVVEAREVLAGVLGQVPRAFAYASGAHDAPARAAVRAAGYDVAFAVHAGVDRHAVPRTDVNPTDTDLTFRLKTAAWWPYASRGLAHVRPLRRMLHTAVGSARR